MFNREHARNLTSIILINLKGKFANFWPVYIGESNQIGHLARIQRTFHHNLCMNIDLAQISNFQNKIDFSLFFFLGESSHFERSREMTPTQSRDLSFNFKKVYKSCFALINLFFLILQQCRPTPARFTKSAWSALKLVALDFTSGKDWTQLFNCHTKQPFKTAIFKGKRKKITDKSLYCLNTFVRIFLVHIGSMLYRLTSVHKV